MGQDGAVSRRVVPPMPAAVLDAVDSFGIPVRMAIIGALRGSPPLSRSEIARALEVDVHTVYPNLLALEELGVIAREHESVSRGQRNGYLLNPERVKELLDAIRLFAGGGTSRT